VEWHFRKYLLPWVPSWVERSASCLISILLDSVYLKMALVWVVVDKCELGGGDLGKNKVQITLHTHFIVYKHITPQNICQIVLEYTTESHRGGGCQKMDPQTLLKSTASHLEGTVIGLKGHLLPSTYCMQNIRYASKALPRRHCPCWSNPFSDTGPVLFSFQQ